jgi:hypothetical protein
MRRVSFILKVLSPIIWATLCSACQDQLRTGHVPRSTLRDATITLFVPRPRILLLAITNQSDHPFDIEYLTDIPLLTVFTEQNGDVLEWNHRTHINIWAHGLVMPTTLTLAPGQTWQNELNFAAYHQWKRPHATLDPTAPVQVWIALPDAEMEADRLSPKITVQPNQLLPAN